MNLNQASYGVIGCASSDDFTARGAFAGMEATIARVGWLEYAERFVAPMVSRWQPRGIVWDMPGGKRQLLDEKGRPRLDDAGKPIIDFPLARFGHLERFSVFLSLEQFCGALSFMRDGCDVKEQVVYLGSPKDLLARVDQALCKSVATGTLVLLVERLANAGASAVVFDATADSEIDGVVSAAMGACWFELRPAQMCVEGPPYKGSEHWMRSYKFGAWQTTEAFRNQQWELDQGKQVGDVRLTDVAASGCLAMMGYNGVCPLGRLEKHAPMAEWMEQWIGQCVRAGIVPCWGMLGNEGLCTVGAAAKVDTDAGAS